MDSNLDQWIRRLTAAAVLAVAAALLVVGFIYYAHGGSPAPAQSTEVR